jgi:LPXTG-site transpeptidase (sortase) family protein
VTSTPWTIKMASLNIDAPLVGIEATSSLTLDPPRNPQQVGWWKQSAKPGSKTGQTIVTGHTVHTGGGQFDHIGDAKAGAEVDITDGTTHKTLRYTVQKVVTLSKEAVDQQANALFSQRNPFNVLVLITCSGWDGHVYHSNVFVYATPVTPSTGAAA